MVAVMKRAGVHIAGAARDQIRPDTEGKLIECHLSHTKCAQAPQTWETSNAAKSGSAARNWSGAGTSGRDPRSGWFARRELVREETGNDSARAYATLEVAFRQELGIRIQNRETRNLSSVPALGWKECAARGGNCRKRYRCDTHHRFVGAGVSQPSGQPRSWGEFRRRLASLAGA